jgi:uncharacterized protein DUF1488
MRYRKGQSCRADCSCHAAPPAIPDSNPRHLQPDNQADWRTCTIFDAAIRYEPAMITVILRAVLHDRTLYTALSKACSRFHKGIKTIPINFPNQSRSYDSTRNAVRFWGYDSAMETSFFITADALQRLRPGAGNDEASLLRAFDANRNLICMTAARVYSRSQRGSYELMASDFVHSGR